MASTVQLNSPLTGDTVANTFTASGVWNGDPPVVRVRLRNESYSTDWCTAQQEGVDSGTWQYTFSDVPSATGYSVESELITSTDPNTVLSADAADLITVGTMDIVIESIKPIDELPTQGILLSGAVSAGSGNMIACALVGLTRPRAQVEMAALQLVAPDGETWECTLPSARLGRPQVVRAFLLAPDGRVVASTSAALSVT